MRYRNKATGNVIDVPCIVEGPDWEPLDKPADKPKKQKKAGTGKQEEPEKTEE